MSNEDKFDQYIKYFLEDYKVEIPVDAWKSFLDSYHKVNLEKSILFDQTIKSKIGVVSNLSTLGSWDHFQDALYYSNTQNEHGFDKAIRAKVNRVESDLKPSEEIISKYGVSIDKRIRRIQYYKIGEVAVILVLMFFAWNYLPDWISRQTTENQLAVLTTNQGDQSEKPIVNSTFPREEATGAFSHNPLIRIKDNNDVLKSDSDKSSLASMEKRNIHNKTIRNEVIPDIGETFRKNIKAERIITDIVDKTTGSTTLAPLNLIPDHQNREQGLLVHQKTISSEDIADIAQNSISTFPGISSSGSINPLQILSGSIAIAKNKKNSGLIDNIFVGVRAGAVIDRVSTPVSNLNGKNTFSKGIFNNITGFLIELENKWVNVETGVSYSFKKYGLENPDNSKGHFINIPVSIKKAFFNGKKIEPYIKIGPDFNIVLASKAKPEQSRGELLALDNYAPSSNFIAKESRQDGILKKGGLQENSYLGIHAAIGAETTIGKGVCLSLELEKQLNPFQKGLGINNQKFTQTTMTIGFKKMIYHDIY